MTDITPNLAAAIETLCDYGRRTCAPRLQALPDGRTAFLVGDTVVETIDRQPDPRGHTFTELCALVAWLAANDNGADVFIGPTSVSALLDPLGERRESVRFNLLPTDTWDGMLASWTKWAAYTPGPGFIRELRAMGVPPDVIAPFRGLVVTRNQRAEVSAKHGSDTLGQRVDREVLNADAIPDAFVMQLAPYRGLDLSLTVRVLVHLDTEHGTVELRLAPETTAYVADSVVEHVTGVLRDDGLTDVYAGVPVLVAAL